MNCGKREVFQEIGSFVVDYGGKKESIEDCRMRCGACGNISYSGSQISAHELAVAAKCRELGGLLSAKALENTRKKYRLTQREMEMLLGTGPKTWIRWERGKVVQSKLADTVIRQIAGDPRFTGNLMRQAGIENEEALSIIERFDAEERRVLELLLRQRVGEVPGVDLRNLAREGQEALREASRQLIGEAA
jgi:putative zinc finger/helix-turn-helix YgiT family protein